MNTTVNGTTTTEAPLIGPSDLLNMLYVVLVYTVLEDKGFRFNNPCVGVLLQPNLVLTALSCLEVSVHGAIEPELIYVFVRNSQVMRPERVFTPNTSRGNNVALILIQETDVTEFPKLPDKEFDINDFEYCFLCGYGSERERIKLENFMTMRLNRSGVEVCNRVGQRTERLCLHFKNASPCRGDVGAPLLCDGAVFAIFNPPVIPWGPPSCVGSYDASFTPVHGLVPWIKKVNSSMEIPVLGILNSPWCWIGTGVTTITIIVGIYYVIMRYVDWRCARDDEAMNRDVEGPRVIFVKSSQMSGITNRWLLPQE